MEQILQILSSKVTMVRSDNSVNRECLWLDLPMDHRKMLYNHCASGILIQPWLIYAFCSYLLDIPRRTCQECFAFLLKPSACYMHIPAEMRASCHQITLPTPILHLMSSTTWLTRSLGGKLPRRIYHVGLLLCRRWFFQPSSAAAKRVFSLLVTMFGDQQHEGLEDYLEAAFMLRRKSR